MACSSEEQNASDDWTQQNTEQNELTTDQTQDQTTVSYENMEIPTLPFELDNFLTASLQKELLTDLIVRIYKRPPGSSKETRFEDQFRNWYVDKLPQFDWMAHKYDNGTHFFLIKRPARNIHQHVRTVGGIFQLNENNEITYFQEVFNTPMLPENEARVKGAIIFNNWMETGSIEKYYNQQEFIEFPNYRTYYNLNTMEWSYDLNKIDTTVNRFLQTN